MNMNTIFDAVIKSPKRSLETFVFVWFLLHLLLWNLETYGKNLTNRL